MVHIVNPRCPMHHMCTTAARVLCTCAICAWNIYSLQRGTNQSLGTNPLTACTMQASPSGPATPASQQSRHRSHRVNIRQWRRPRRATHTRTHTQTHTRTHIHAQAERKTHRKKVSHGAHRQPRCPMHHMCTTAARVCYACTICVWNIYPLQRGTNQSQGTNLLTS